VKLISRTELRSSHCDEYTRIVLVRHGEKTGTVVWSAAPGSHVWTFARTLLVEVDDRESPAAQCWARGAMGLH
jgi:hypothetical protein